jgi:hypothetical protein
MSALSKIQYGCNDFIIISQYIHTGLAPYVDISRTVTYHDNENLQICSHTVRTHEYEAN